MKTGNALKAVEPAPPITVDACSKMVESVTKACAPIEAQSAPNWDAMANSFASLSAAIAWGSLILAVVAFVAAFAWGRIVTNRAEKEARAEAKKCANELIQKWLAEEAPQIIRLNVEIITNATLGTGNDENAADDIGKEAG